MIMIKYICNYNKINKLCFRFTNCPLFVHGIYPNNKLCSLGVIEIDWVQSITYRELLNEYFIKL